MDGCGADRAVSTDDGCADASGVRTSRGADALGMCGVGSAGAGRAGGRGRPMGSGRGAAVLRPRWLSRSRMLLIDPFPVMAARTKASKSSGSTSSGGGCVGLGRAAPQYRHVARNVAFGRRHLGQGATDTALCYPACRQPQVFTRCQNSTALPHQGCPHWSDAVLLPKASTRGES